MAFFHSVIIFCLGSEISITVSHILQVEIVSLGSVKTTSTTSMAFVAPAIETAITEFNEFEYNRYLNFSLHLLFNASLPADEDFADHCQVMISEWYYRNRSLTADVSVIVLPGGTEDLQINHLAMNWNILLITSGSSMPEILDKTQSATWVTTTAFSPSEAVDVYGNIFSRFLWTSLYIILDMSSSPVFHSAAGAIANKFLFESGFQLTNDLVNCFNKSDVENALLRFASSSRVLLFFGHAKQLRSLMIQAHRMQLTGQEYVYLVLEPYRSNIIGEFTWIYNESSDAVAFEAFQSVLLLAPDDPALHSGDEERHFAPEWRKMTLDQFNYTYAEGEMFAPAVASSHYTMDFLALILNETLVEREFNYENGAALAMRFFNRSFTFDGEDFYIDKSGQRQVKWWLSYFDIATGRFQRFMSQDEKLQTLQQLSKVTWYGGNSLPPNVPRCGFRGFSTLCVLSGSTWTVVVAVIVASVVLMVPLVTGNWWRKKRNHAGVWWNLKSNCLEIPLNDPLGQ